MAGCSTNPGTQIRRRSTQGTAHLEAALILPIIVLILIAGLRLHFAASAAVRAARWMHWLETLPDDLLEPHLAQMAAHHPKIQSTCQIKTDAIECTLQHNANTIRLRRQTQGNEQVHHVTVCGPVDKCQAVTRKTLRLWSGAER